MEMEANDTWSFNDGADFIDVDTRRELEQIADVFHEHGGAPETHHKRKDALAPMGWEIEKRASFTTEVDDDNCDIKQVGRGVSVDAYKDGIALEHESKELMRGLWHLVKLDAINGGYSDEDLEVDVGVLLMPSGSHSSDEDGNGSLRRIRESARAILEPSADLSIPLFVWEYPVTNKCDQPGSSNNEYDERFGEYNYEAPDHVDDEKVDRLTEMHEEREELLRRHIVTDEDLSDELRHLNDKITYFMMI